MAITSLTAAQRQQIAADPNVAAIMADPKHGTPMLRDAAVNNYLSNDPRSPLRDVFGAEANLRPDGVPAGGLHYDPVTGKTEFTNTYGHPGTMKAIGMAIPAIATAGSLALAGGAGAAGGASAGSLPASLPGSYASTAYGAGQFAAPSAAVGGSHVAGLGGLTGLLKTLGKNVITNPDALGAIASTASGAAKGKQDSRLVEGNQALTYAQLAQQAARDKYQSDLAGSTAQFGTGLQGAQFSREGQDRERKSAILSQLLNNTKDFSVTPGNPAIAKAMGTSTGGARPSNLTTNSGALQALLAQPQIAAPTYTAPTPYQAPKLPTAPQAGALENILGGIGLGGNFLAALGQYKNGDGGSREVAAPPTPQTPSLWAGLPQSPQLMNQAVADPNNPAAVNAELMKRGFLNSIQAPRGTPLPGAIY